VPVLERAWAEDGVALGAASARARILRWMIPAAWLHQAALVAVVIWGGAHCGRVTQLQRPLPSGTGAQAVWGPSTCRIEYSRHPIHPWRWQHVCATTIHEWGHLTGHGHSRNPRSIMYPEGHEADSRCLDFGWPFLDAHRAR
jgi:hypothetical protein